MNANDKGRTIRGLKVRLGQVKARIAAAGETAQLAKERDELAALVEASGVGESSSPLRDAVGGERRARTSLPQRILRATAVAASIRGTTIEAMLVAALRAYIPEEIALVEKHDRQEAAAPPRGEQE